MTLPTGHQDRSDQTRRSLLLPARLWQARRMSAIATALIEVREAIARHAESPRAHHANARNDAPHDAPNDAPNSPGLISKASAKTHAPTKPDLNDHRRLSHSPQNPSDSSRDLAESAQRAKSPGVSSLQALKSTWVSLGGQKLIAVSKGHGSEAIREAYEAGQRDFGENYVQELMRKADELRDLDGIVWHAIGSLQRNKVKDVCRVAGLIHTVDRASLADEIAKRASGPIKVLIEVNIGEETQKAGCLPSEVSALAAHIARLENVTLAGLMTIPPHDENAEATRPFFARMRALRDTLLAAGFETARELSMGMSSDFGVAIEEGATMIRVGTAIFGARAPRDAETPLG
jgi:PLP dependent protein